MLAIYGQQIRHHLPCHGQRGSVAVVLLLLLFVDHGQLRAQSGRRLRSLHQNALDVFVSLLRQRIRITLSAELRSSPHGQQ